MLHHTVLLPEWGCGINRCCVPASFPSLFEAASVTPEEAAIPRLAKSRRRGSLT